jgi:hypothetical protein
VLYRGDDGNYGLVEEQPASRRIACLRQNRRLQYSLSIPWLAALTAEGKCVEQPAEPIDLHV